MFFRFVTIFKGIFLVISKPAHKQAQAHIPAQNSRTKFQHRLLHKTPTQSSGTTPAQIPVHIPNLIFLYISSYKID
jgi:hypothetical protein